MHSFKGYSNLLIYRKENLSYMKVLTKNAGSRALSAQEDRSNESLSLEH